MTLLVFGMSWLTLAPFPFALLLPLPFPLLPFPFAFPLLPFAFPLPLPFGLLLPLAPPPTRSGPSIASVQTFAAFKRCTPAFPELATKAA